MPTLRRPKMSAQRAAVGGTVAYISGLIRVQSGSYLYAFIMAGILAILGGLLALRIGHKADVLASPAPVVLVARA